MKPAKTRGRPRRTRPSGKAAREPQDVDVPADPVSRQPGTGRRLTAGDVDADWGQAESPGEETIGGSVATPDQDVVDEIGRAFGVEQEDEAELTTSEEMLRRRDRLRWQLEYDAEARERAEEERPEAL